MNSSNIVRGGLSHSVTVGLLNCFHIDVIFLVNLYTSWLLWQLFSEVHKNFISVVRFESICFWKNLTTQFVLLSCCLTAQLTSRDDGVD